MLLSSFLQGRIDGDDNLFAAKESFMETASAGMNDGSNTGLILLAEEIIVQHLLDGLGFYVVEEG